MFVNLPLYCFLPRGFLLLFLPYHTLCMVPHLMLPQMSSVIYSNEHIDSKKSSHIMLISVCSSWRIVDGETYSMKDLALSLCGLIQRPGSKLRNLSVSHVSHYNSRIISSVMLYYTHTISWGSYGSIILSYWHKDFVYWKVPGSISNPIAMKWAPPLRHPKGGIPK